MDIITLKQSLKTDIWKITGNAAKSLEAKLDRLMSEKIETPKVESPVDEVPNPVNILNLNGEIVKRLGFPREILEFVGIQDLDFLDEDITNLLDDPSLNKDSIVLLNVSSGGGSVMGLEETGELLDELDKKVNLIAYTDTLMCSAAYQLASHASTIYASPSSWVGMVGTYCQRWDISEYLRQKGIKVDTFGEGKYKTMYVPEIPLTDEQRALFKEEIHRANEDFKFIVTRKRVIAEEDLQGQIFTGKEAVTKGFVEGLVPSMKQLLGQLK